MNNQKHLRSKQEYSVFGRTISAFMAVVMCLSLVFGEMKVLSANVYADESSANEDFDVYVYMAKHIASADTPAGEQLRYLFNDFQSAAQIVMNAAVENPDFAASVTAWEALNVAFDPSTAVKKMTDARTYYMTVILSILKISYESESIMEQFLLVSNGDSESAKNAVNAVKNFVGVYNDFTGFYEKLNPGKKLSDITEKTVLTDKVREELRTAQTKYLKEQKFLSVGKSAKDIINIIDILEKPNQYVDAFVKYCGVFQLCQEWKDCLKSMYKKSSKDNVTLRSALKSLVDASKSLDDVSVQVLEDFVMDSTQDVYAYSVNKAVDYIIEACPELLGIKIGAMLGNTISNLLFGTDKVTEEYYIIKDYCEIYNLFALTFNEVIKEYSKNPDHDNSERFLKYLDLYFSVINVGNDFGIDWIDTVNKEGLFNFVFHNKKRYKQLSEDAESIKASASVIIKGITTNWLYQLETDNPEMYKRYADLLITKGSNQNYDYTIMNGEVTITKYKGNAAKVSIPKTILMVTRLLLLEIMFLNGVKI